MGLDDAFKLDGRNNTCKNCGISYKGGKHSVKGKRIIVEKEERNSGSIGWKSDTREIHVSKMRRESAVFIKERR